MNHGETLRPVLGLHEMDAVDHRIPDLTVRVADDDEIGPRGHRGERRGVILRADARRVIARLAKAAVNEHHLQIDAGAIERGQRSRPRFGNAADSDATRELSPIPQHHAGGGQPGDTDLDGPARYDGRGREQCLPAVVDDVRRDVAVGRLGRGAPQEIDAEIEIMVARRDGVVLQRIQRVDDRLRLALVVAAKECGEVVALQQIAGVEQHEVAGIPGAEGLERRCGTRQAPGGRSIAHIIPAHDSAMNVGRRDDDNVRGIGSSNCLEREQQRGEDLHSARKIAKRTPPALPSALRRPDTVNLAVPQRILVVDDEPDITALVAYHLAKEGYRVTTAGTGADALRSAREERPDMVVLDLMLPGHSGFEVLAELRRRDETRDVGVLLLTARKDEPDRIKGLSLGADDYLAKPFSPKELVLRVGAILRRLAAPPVSAGGRLVGGPIVLDRPAHRVTVAGEETELTATEFKLLERLIERRDRVQSRSQLLESVWQAQPDIQTRTVDMHVQRLRAKLGAAGDWIETVRAVGYRFREPVTPPKRPTPAPRRRRT